MAGTTSAYVIVGEHATGPFHARQWKARNGIALIEKHLPVWMPGEIAHGTGLGGPQAAIILPTCLTAAEQLVIVLAATTIHDDDFMQALHDEGLAEPIPAGHGDATMLWLSVPDERIDDGAPVSASLVEHAAATMQGRARLGLVRLEPTSLLDTDAVIWLRGQGLDVDEFTINPVNGSPQ